MIKPINMPKYGLQQDEGTIIEWKKQEGDRVEKGDILLEVETDKAVFEYEAPENGYLRHILAQDGAVVPVLSPIAVLTDELDETVDLDAFTTPEPTASAEAAAPQIEASIPESTQAAQTSTHSNRIKRSPAARHRARELDIDLSTVTGTGPGGRIVKADIERTAASPPPVSAGSSALSKMRQAIGKTMAFSKSTIPHFKKGGRLYFSKSALRDWIKNGK